MPTPSIREASKTCFHGCCLSLLIEPHDTSKNSSPSSLSSCWHDFEASIASTLDPEFTNHESLPSLEESFSSFIKAFPQFLDSKKGDQIRAQEYYHLSLSKHVCFDYIGHGLFSYSQVKPPSLDIASSSSTSGVFSVLQNSRDHFQSQPLFLDGTIDIASSSGTSEVFHVLQDSRDQSKSQPPFLDGIVEIASTSGTSGVFPVLQTPRDPFQSQPPFSDDTFNIASSSSSTSRVFPVLHNSPDHFQSQPPFPDDTINIASSSSRTPRVFPALQNPRDQSQSQKPFPDDVTASSSSRTPGVFPALQNPRDQSQSQKPFPEDVIDTASSSSRTPGVFPALQNPRDQFQSLPPFPDDVIDAASSSSRTPRVFPALQNARDHSQPQPPFFDVSYKSMNLKSLLQYGSQESEFESQIRTRLMAFMNISEDDYTMVFTANKSSAFKIVADSYPFQTNQNLVLVYDHKSEATEVMIESSKRRGARVISAEFLWPNLKIQSKNLMRVLKRKDKEKNKSGLFVFPLQSKISGARYSYRWMGLARENGFEVLLDTSALGAKDMETLGLSIFKPDFLFSSCFKIFGENPSGFGCLFIKKSSALIFKDSPTSIGIVSLVPITPQDHNNKNKVMTFSEILELERPPKLLFKGLDHADSLGLVMISYRTRYLINWLVNAFLSLKHPNSQNALPLVRIYGPKVRFDRGHAVAFNVFDWKGEKVDPSIVQKLGGRNNISLSCGALKQIVFLENVLKLETRSSEVSVVTASLGFLTNFEDVYRLWVFVSRFLDADFVEKERWRYTGLNQKTVEV